MYRLVVVDHSFIEKQHRKRWRILSEDYPVEVTLLVPEVWHSEWTREGDSSPWEKEYVVETVSEDRFRVLPLRTSNTSDWTRYVFLSSDMCLRSLDPDHVHVQHNAMSLIHQQVITYLKMWARDAKYTFFTMNAQGVRQEKWHQKFRWWNVKRNAAAAFGHYPGCKRSLRESGFDKPIYVQTSYGLDEDLFYPNRKKRKEVRKQIGVEDRFVVGFVGRLTPDKGVDDLLDAMPIENVPWSLLFVGDGEYYDKIESTACNRGWEDRVEMTGFVPQYEVAKYMRAMDCFVLGSKTRDDWIDTFPRTIVQAMACGVPVIGSDSGAIPYQVRDAGLIYPEGEAAELGDRIHELATDPNRREELGRAGRESAVSRFGQAALAEGFYEIMTDLL